MSAAVVLYVRAAGRWLTLVFIAFALMVPLILIDPVIKIGTGRELSVGQMIDNVASLFGGADNPGLEGTKEFRAGAWQHRRLHHRRSVLLDPARDSGSISPTMTGSNRRPIGRCAPRTTVTWRSSPEWACPD